MPKTAQYPQIIKRYTENLVINPKDLPKSLKKIKFDDEIKIVYFGTSEFSSFVLEKLLASFQNPQVLDPHPRGRNQNLIRFVIQAVVSTPDKPVGRGHLLTPTPVYQVAQKYHLPILTSEKLDDQFIKDHLSLLQADLFIVVAYGKILPASLLNIPILGSLNLHPSLLPKYRGASPIQAAILNGDKKTGITIIKMDEKMDHGSIISTSKISILEKDNYLTLSNRMMQESAALLVTILSDFVQGKLISQTQNHQKATYCKLIKKEGGYFEINNPPIPKILERMIRAYYPWPTAWTKWNNKIIKFLPEGMVQLEGKKPVKLKDFLNGYPDFPIKSI